MRNASMTALLILAATAIGLLLAELGVRFSALAAKPVAASGARAPLDPALRGLPILKQKIRRPNVRGIHYGVLHRTNSRGVRGPEYAAEPAEGTFRIVLVGDSFAMGHRVDEAETYAALTEQSLNRGDADLHFEIINAGLSGLNINAVVGRLEAVGLPYLPDLIVYGFTPNDIYGPEYVPNTQAQRDAFASERARFDDSGLYLLRWFWPRWISLRSALDPLPGSHELALNRNYFENPAAWAEIDRGFARLGRISEESDRCVVVLIHPVLQDLGGLHPFRDIYDRVQQVATGYGLFVTQAWPHFMHRSAVKLRFGPDDNHPNVDGHRLLAQALEEGLHGLPARCIQFTSNLAPRGDRGAAEPPGADVLRRRFAARASR